MGFATDPMNSVTFAYNNCTLLAINPASIITNANLLVCSRHSNNVIVDKHKLHTFGGDKLQVDIFATTTEGEAKRACLGILLVCAGNLSHRPAYPAPLPSCVWRVLLLLLL